MFVSASVGLAILVLGISFMVQSRVLLDPPDRLPLLGRRLQLLLFVFFPTGIALLIFGLVVPDFFNSYVSVGVTLDLLYK